MAKTGIQLMKMSFECEAFTNAIKGVYLRILYCRICIVAKCHRKVFYNRGREFYIEHRRDKVIVEAKSVVTQLVVQLQLESRKSNGVNGFPFKPIVGFWLCRPLNLGS